MVETQQGRGTPQDLLASPLKDSPFSVPVPLDVSLSLLLEGLEDGCSPEAQVWGATLTDAHTLLPLFQNGEVECSFTPCPELECPREEWWLRPGQCCFTCREPTPTTGEDQLCSPQYRREAGLLSLRLIMCVLVV